MPMSSRTHLSRPGVRAEDGFTMIVVLGVMLVTSLLLAAGFAASNGEIELSHKNVVQQQAYFAALAGVQEFEYQLQSNPDYWEECPSPSGTEEGERYEVTVLGANGRSACSSAEPFKTAIESTGAAANTFRILATGCAGEAKLGSCKGQSKVNVRSRAVVATFRVTGFLDYVYFTQYEDEDPEITGQSAAECERYYKVGASTRSENCINIVFAGEDNVNGPMHTNDSALVECNSSLSFGRSGHSPPDLVEMYGGALSYSTGTACPKGSEPTYNSEGGKPAKGEELRPPQSDTSLKLYVEPQNEFAGVTHIVLNGSKANVKYWKMISGKLTEVEENIEPKNGLIYVKANPSAGCTFKFSEDNSDEPDSASEVAKETGCGNVYVSGNYSRSLTIAAEGELIVNNSITQTGVPAGEPPTGTNTLGLIATYYVRVYHPCTQFGGEQSGYLSNPWIYAAMLSTAHSFIVDNYGCGSQAKVGTLNVDGAIGQKFRGPVGLVGTSGYHKDYIYDERLATDEPPFFLSPLKAGWKVVRVTSANPG
jgi:Tfp pilus assembly protein PilX